jgi:hypothetical protein
MEDQLSLLNSVPGWQFVLAHYARSDASAISQTENPDNTAQPKQKNWLNRYETFSNSAADELEERYSQLTDQQISQAHGILIALGYLEFDLVNRSAGIGYSLTYSGKKLLANPHLLEENQPEEHEPNFNDNQAEAA